MFYSHPTQKLLSIDNQRGKIITLILAVAFIPQLCIDLYLPSMPAMTEYFHTSNRYIQYTLAIYLLSCGVSQLVYGPFTDQYGRRPVILFGLVIFFVGSLGCVLTNNIYLFLFWRLVQGAGGAAATVVSRAVIRDTYDGNKLTKILSYANMAWITIPILAPVLGGYIQHYLNWRMNFILIFILAAMGLVMIWKLFPETHHGIISNQITEHTILTRYYTVLKNSSFLLFVICATFINVLMLAYNMISPFLLQISLNITPVTFGWTAVVVTIGYLIGSTITSQCVIKFGTQYMIIVGSVLLLGSSLLFLLLAALNYFNLWAVLLPVSMIFIGAGICYPNFSSSALQHFKHLSGTAGSILGVIQTGVGSLLAVSVTFLPNYNAVAFSLYCLAIVISLLITVGVISYRASY